MLRIIMMIIIIIRLSEPPSLTAWPAPAPASGALEGR